MCTAYDLFFVNGKKEGRSEKELEILASMEAMNFNDTIIMNVLKVTVRKLKALRSMRQQMQQVNP